MASLPPNSVPKSADGETAHRDRRLCISGAPAHPLEDTNILPEILLRLPPLPSSLFRASPVCKRWGHVVSDPHFHRRFRAHHKNPPLLGFFFRDHHGNIAFRPALDAPNRIPAARFSLQLEHGTVILGCHHGRVLALNELQPYFVVWDPITGDHRNVAFPPEFREENVLPMNGAVLCAARENGHVHGACHSDPFKVVFLGWNIKRIFACIYSSETRTWGKLVSVLQPRIFLLSVLLDCQSYLIGDSLYWVLMGGVGGILQFDLHRETLAIMDVRDAYDFYSFQGGGSQFLIMPANGGSLSFIVLDGFTVHVWNKITNGDDVPTRWVLENSVELIDLLSLKPRGDTIKSRGPLVRILGVDEDDMVMFKLTES